MYWVLYFSFALVLETFRFDYRTTFEKRYGKPFHPANGDHDGSPHDSYRGDCQDTRPSLRYINQRGDGKPIGNCYSDRDRNAWSDNCGPSTCQGRCVDLTTMID